MIYNIVKVITYIYSDINYYISDTNKDDIISTYCLQKDMKFIKTVSLSIDTEEIIVEYKILSI